MVSIKSNIQLFKFTGNCFSETSLFLPQIPAEDLQSNETPETGKQPASTLYDFSNFNYGYQRQVKRNPFVMFFRTPLF